MELFWKADGEEGLSEEQIREAVRQTLEQAGRPLKRVLIVPPDFTRFHSNAGFIVNCCYHLLEEKGCHADILPALGTHAAMSREQFSAMYGDIPFERMLVHDWRRDVMSLGEVPGTWMEEITEGLWKKPVQAEINRRVMDPSYDLVLSVGQVVPHEIVGMASHAKNLFVGVGGSDMINQSHMVGAVYGMERIMGKDKTPVRRIFDYAWEHFLRERPVIFMLTVTTAPEGRIRTHGLFAGDTRKVLEEAVALSQEKNIRFLDREISKCVVYLDPAEFHSTWLGNKAVYRTRMAIADGGELLILAPGVSQFGEDEMCDKLIRKYGYCGRKKILELFEKERELQENMGTAAHLIHGSSDGRFRITYGVSRIPEEEMRGVGFGAVPYEEAARRYPPEKLKDGWNRMPDGEEIYYISNPALGLWINKKRFEGL